MTIRNRLLSLLLATLCATAVHAQEDIRIDYSYDGNARLSNVRPALRFAEFTDSRGVDNPRQLISSGLDGSGDGYQAEAALAELVRDAFVQAFEKGGATLVDSGEEMQIAGDVSMAAAELVDRDGVESIQFTLRTRIQLQGRGRTIYENNLFGRSVVPAADGLAAAVGAALDRMIRDLTSDDYFLIELM